MHHKDGVLNDSFVQSDLPIKGALDYTRFLRPTAAARPTSEIARTYAGRNVMITGAGGSIGISLAESLGSASLRRLTLVDASERNLYETERRMILNGSDTRYD